MRPICMIDKYAHLFIVDPLCVDIRSHQNVYFKF